MIHMNAPAMQYMQDLLRLDDARFHTRGPWGKEIKRWIREVENKKEDALCATVQKMSDSIVHKGHSSGPHDAVHRAKNGY